MKSTGPLPLRSCPATRGQGSKQAHRGGEGGYRKDLPAGREANRWIEVAKGSVFEISASTKEQTNAD
jgi:hypothetical protein